MSEDRATELRSAAATELNVKDGAELVWVPVRDAVRMIWKDNPKRHDMGAIVQSIDKYGFIDKSVYDTNLVCVDGTKGAIKSGNGRLEALAMMEKSGEYELPRGCAVGKVGGEWYVQIMVGTDAESRVIAEAYAIDANNLTLAGGDLTAFDYEKMYGPQYNQIIFGLAEQGVFTVSVDREVVDLMISMTQAPDLDDLAEEYGETLARDFWPVLEVAVSPGTRAAYNRLKMLTGQTDEALTMELLFRAVDKARVAQEISTRVAPHVLEYFEELKALTGLADDGAAMERILDAVDSTKLGAEEQGEDG